jgi:endonuclease/exonuclease/phosphatase family metal-dependent hydrolase
VGNAARITARSRRTAIVAGLPAILFVFGCSEPKITQIGPPPENPFTLNSVGTDTTFEVVTWNLENFATNSNAQEVALTAQAVVAMAADLVAVQEIRQGYRFSELLSAVPGYAGYQSSSNNYQNLGYLWLESEVVVHEIYELCHESWCGRPFPRRPLVLELVWRGREIVVVNNHLKAFGSGYIDHGNESDNGYRRLWACRWIEEWIDTEQADRAVIVLGDMNDVLTIPPPNNVFEPFYLRPDRYRFADQDLAEGPVIGWSYPSWPSHIDHILVTNQLFAALDAPGSACLTLRLDHALEAGQFLRLVSDHLPVVVVLPQSAMQWQGWRNDAE